MWKTELTENDSCMKQQTDLVYFGASQPITLHLIAKLKKYIVSSEWESLTELHSSSWESGGTSAATQPLSP